MKQLYFRFQLHYLIIILTKVENDAGILKICFAYDSPFNYQERMLHDSHK